MAGLGFVIFGFTAQAIERGLGQREHSRMALEFGKVQRPKGFRELMAQAVLPALQEPVGAQQFGALGAGLHEVISEITNNRFPSDVQNVTSADWMSAKTLIDRVRPPEERIPEAWRLRDGTCSKSRGLWYRPAAWS